MNPFRYERASDAESAVALLLVVPKTHRLAGEAHVPLSEVAHEAVVIDKVGSGLRESGTSKAGISSRQFAYLAVLPTYVVLGRIRWEELNERKKGTRHEYPFSCVWNWDHRSTRKACKRQL